MTVNHTDPKLVALTATLNRRTLAAGEARAALREVLGFAEGELNYNQLLGRAQALAPVNPDVARALSALVSAELAQAGAEDDVNAFYCEAEPAFCRRVD